MARPYRSSKAIGSSEMSISIRNMSGSRRRSPAPVCTGRAAAEQTRIGDDCRLEVGGPAQKPAAAFIQQDRSIGGERAGFAPKYLVLFQKRPPSPSRPN